MRRLIPLLCLFLTLVVGGCGSGAAAGGTDPAKLVPADSALYLEAVVRPDGDQGDNAKQIAGKLLQTADPGAKIRAFVDKAIREDGKTKATFDEDIDPWLGDRIGVALSDLQRDAPRYSVVIASRDNDAAANALTKSATANKARHAGDHWIDPDGTTYGIVGEAVVVASDEKTFQRAVAAKDGAHLSGSQAYDAALAPLPDDRIGTFYLDSGRLFDAISASNSDPVSAAIVRKFGAAATPYAAALVAGQDTLTVESATKTPKAGSPSALFGVGSGGATPLLRSVPAGSWGALGLPDVGKSAKSLVATVGGALGGAVLQSQLDKLGIDLDRDVFSWIGDVAFFVQGDSSSAVRGGAIIDVTDHDAAANGIRKLVGLARQQGGAPFKPISLAGADFAFSAQETGMPDAVVVALAGDRAVITYGADAAEQALKPSQTIEQDGLYGRAQAAIGGLDPTLVLDAAPIVKLIGEASGGDADFAKAKPYLDTLDLLAAGSKVDGDHVRGRFALKLR